VGVRVRVSGVSCGQQQSNSLAEVSVGVQMDPNQAAAMQKITLKKHVASLCTCDHD
jgi:hypothetical protein